MPIVPKYNKAIAVKFHPDAKMDFVCVGFGTPPPPFALLPKMWLGNQLL